MKAEELVEEFESAVIEWRAERGGPDKDYERWAREAKDKIKARLIKALERVK